MKTPGSVFLLAGIVMLAILLSVPSALAEWPMEGSDPAHTGEQQTPVIGPADQWEYPVNGELMCPPATGYGQLFIGTSDGFLKVLDEADGHEVWGLKLGETVCATPLVESQTVFLPVGNTVYAVSIQDRDVRWTFEAIGALRASAVHFENVIYIGSEDKHIYALDKYDGHLVWSLKLDDVVATSPSVSGLTLVAGTEAGTVYGVHRNQGEELWKADLGSPISTAASISRGIAMVGTYGGRLNGIDMEDGALEWTYPAKGQPALDPILTTPVTSSGLVYIGADGLYCIEVVTGEEVWSFQTGDSVRGSAAIVENYLVFGSYDGFLRCLDKTTANVIWRFQADTVFRAGVTIDYDKAFIGGRDGVLYARSILNRQPPTVTGTFNIEAEAHDSIRFEVQASDPEDNLLTYVWDFGDGNNSHEPSPLHQYPSAGDYTVTVSVSDGTKTKKHTISVTVNPFESKVTGGDEDGTPIALVAGGAAAAAVAVVLVLFFLFRMRRKDDTVVPEDDATPEPDALIVSAVDAPEPPPDVVWDEEVNQ
jgi:outer membrane protein assembly factor BamB